MKNIKKLTYAGLLTALAIVIPLTFGFLKIQAGPFSATLAAHVPLFIAMLLGPFAAVMVGAGSALGFLVSAPAVVAARAFMHTFVGLAGALLIKKGVSFSKVVLITAPIHAILEAIAVIPFGFTMYKVLVVVGVGSFLHHMVDGIIAFALVKALAKNLRLDLRKSTI
ncbi:ECF transporter S component [Clostridium sp. JS66]|uniref:ECF transporter S component n=1 Tax=Clostridium sp. JS66 TaxID=3064705 RepID=UPI00298DE977|nr:ECF transporter S component [Clostridium sp. JS66]WPC39192.1 ECF transporter S component [Clostridium sp. JS66]